MTTASIHPVSDHDLLRHYVGSRCPDAFARLVGRYLPLIYSAALRQTRDPQLAEDVAQAVLIILSQKAGRIDPPTLPGWLIKTAHYAARNAIRQRDRRAFHEQRAAAMKSESHLPDPATDDADAFSRVLDPALARLGEVDRTAVVLRYFQDKSFADVAAHLRTTESAAQRRISRAVEKLRAILARQGVVVAPSALPAYLASQTIHPVPASLSAAGSVTPSPAASTSLIAKGALHAMAATKLKLAAVAAAVLVAAVATPVVLHLTATAPTVIPASPVTFPAPITGSLPPGISAEPVAVARIADGRWFGPDGKPVAGIPDRLLTIAAKLAPRATHAFCYHLKAPPRSARMGYLPLVEGAGGYGSGGFTDPITGLEWSVIGFPLEPTSDALTLTVRATDQPITTDAVVPATSTEVFHGTIASQNLTINPPSEQGGKAHFSIMYEKELSDTELSVYAVNIAGSRVYHTSTGLLDGKLGSRVYIYGVPLASLREFHVESRPYNYHASYTPVPLAPVR